MDIELSPVAWEDYVKIRSASKILVGYPAYYTMEPDTHKCIVWPTPTKGVTLFIRVDTK